MAVAAAHHEQGHGARSLHPAVRKRREGSLPLQAGVEPAQVELAGEVLDRGRCAELDVAGIGTAVASVGPGTHDEHHRSGLDPGQFEEALDGARRVGVVPAADVEHRDVRTRLVVLGPVAADAPEVVVVVAVVLHLEVVVLEVGRGGERVLPLPERRVREPVRRALRFQPGPDARLVGHRGELAVRPAELLAQLEGAVIAHLVGPGVRQAPHGQHQGLEARRVQLRRVGLGVGPVRGAPHAHRRQYVVEPDDPLDGVGAVRRVELVVLLEHSLGEVEAAHVLHDHHVAVGGEPAGLLGETLGGLVVGGAVEEHRKALVHRLAAGGGPVHVGREAHSVPHGDHEVLLDLEGLVGRRGAPARVRSVPGPAGAENGRAQEGQTAETHAVAPAGAPERASARPVTRGASSTRSTCMSASSIRSGGSAPAAQSRNFCRNSSRVSGRSGPPG